MEVNRPGDVVTYTASRTPGCSVEFLFCDRCNMAGGHDDDCWEWQVGELARQLAAANERAGRLEAQMVELREAWQAIRGTALSSRSSTLYSCADSIDRILGGA